MRRQWMMRMGVVLAVGGGLLGGALPVFAQNKKPTVAGITGRIATIDVVRAFNEYEGQKDLAQEFKEEDDKLRVEDQTRRSRIDSLQATLDKMSPTDPNYMKKNKEYFDAQIDYKNWADLKRAAIAREMAIWTTKIYKDILEAVKDHAEHEGIDLVLTKDEFEPASIDPKVIQQQIADRKVLYASPAADISGIVIEKMNAAYRAQPHTKKLNVP